MRDFTVKASQSVLRRSVQLQKPAASLHEPCIASTKIDQHAGKLSSALALDLRKAQNQDDQHRLEGPYDQPVESVNKFGDKFFTLSLEKYEDIISLINFWVIQEFVPVNVSDEELVEFLIEKKEITILRPHARLERSRSVVIESVSQLKILPPR